MRGAIVAYITVPIYSLTSPTYSSIFVQSPFKKNVSSFQPRTPVTSQLSSVSNYALQDPESFYYHLNRWRGN